ncbi:unnamed protein product [Oppiella nova]|uniref:G domain-containing protein n=1 Tax=Oppiella nova TaxID=334625 RepID=A0A7R9QGG4_9ACAR|nr:unnamed protein product [Oppiella nova]CAG2165373.1 unnamed protein product [Oppiella nova]
MSNKKKITILLLGESGVGKSTFINAFVNYITYENMYQAKEKPICFIPVNFTIADRETYRLRTVTLGTQDNNENTQDATESATQYPKCYKFAIGNVTLNIIDTPGIADTKGIDKDNTNMRNILNFISNYREINAICVLLKPNNAKSAADNILFLFTNARSTQYAPGDTGPALITLLDQIKERPPFVDIQYGKPTIYCFDNEAFRFAVASAPPNNMVFDDVVTRDYEMSWQGSVKECDRLLERILSLPPHKVMDTLSLNNAKQNILLLTQPLADIAKNISDNVKQCERHKQRIHEFTGDINATAREASMAQQDQIKKIKLKIDELTIENNLITKCMAKFACFLKNNALTPFNDAFEDYVNVIIENEKQGGSKVTIDKLEQMLKRYKYEKDVIVDAMKKSDQGTISVEDIDQVIKQLCGLKWNGPTISKLLATQIQSKAQSHAYNEQHINSGPGFTATFGKLTKYRNMSSKRVITILLVGEPGIDKFVFINAFANYITFKDFYEGSEQPICIFPIDISIVDAETYEVKNIKLGNSDNMVTGNTNEPTTPKCYSFSTNDIQLNIIDTPGIVDINGEDSVNTNNTNIRNLLDFISNYREINAICVLLKPSDTRVDVIFKYCLSQLLSHLNRSAADNILFLFADTYKPGNSASILISELSHFRENTPHIDIKQSKQIIYCINYDPFRYSVASSSPNNMDLDKNIKADQDINWMKLDQE